MIVSNIFHLADIHIRNLKRHKEYRAVFDKVYAEIENRKDDGSVVVIAGDLFHSKTELSPESVNLATEFLKSLCNITPVVIIPGNHDGLEKNLHRLDAISPIVNALHASDSFYRKRLVFYKDSGVYDYYNIVFCVYSIFGDKSEWPSALTLNKNVDCVVGLYHGPVNNSMTDNDFVMHNYLDIDTFDGCDVVLLGDIHRTNQWLNEEKTIAYPGSLITQNHSETNDKGFIHWNLPGRTYEFIQVENDYGYLTLEVKRGRIVDSNWKAILPKKPRLRLKIADTTKEQLELVLDEIRNNCVEISDLRKQTLDRYLEASIVEQERVGNVRDVTVQNRLISTYLKEKGVGENVIREVCDLNLVYNSRLPDVDVARGVSWTPLKLEFSNMFSYGSDNIIDFTKLGGNVGIFAPNSHGKSSIIHILTYCLFDKCAKTSRAKDVLNTKSDSFWCKLTFMIGESVYAIERIGRESSKRSGTISVDVNFTKINPDGTQTNLNSTDRSATNKVIRQHVGDYDDFISTSAYLQDREGEFVAATQKDRKEILSKFLDIDVFSQLYDLANKEQLEDSAILKHGNEQEKKESVDANAKRIVSLREEYVRLQHIETEVNKKVAELSAEIDKLRADKRPTTNVPPINTLKVQFDKNERDRVRYESEISAKEKELTVVSTELETLKRQVRNVDEAAFKKAVDELKELERQISVVKKEISGIEFSLPHLERKVEQLDEHEYDPNCQYCVKNKFVIDAKEAATQIPILTQELQLKRSVLGDLTVKVDELSVSVSEYENIKDIKAKIETLRERLNNGDEYINTRYEKISLCDDIKTKIEKDIELFYTVADDVKYNAELDDKIKDALKELDEVKKQLSEISAQKSDVSVEGRLLKNQNEKLIDEIDELKEISNRVQVREVYLKAIKRDALPHKILQDIIPKIESACNEILFQVSEFSLILESDDKNIYAFITYGDEIKWPLELVGGMEKFVTSLAIRSVLVSLSNLPRPDFFVIDEGYSVLDTENLSGISVLLDYLKEKFKFILSISHLEVMRDMVDMTLDVKKRNGFSHVDNAIV